MADLQGDYSQLYGGLPQESVASVFGHNFLGQLLGFSGASENYDWAKQEQSANNALYRDLTLLSEQNAFNRIEAQKSRDWQERMSNSAYQRAVKDMRLAGLNPSLAYSQGGASSGSTSSASSGSAGASSGMASTRRPDNSLSAITQIVAGLISKSASITAAGISAASKSTKSNKRR